MCDVLAEGFHDSAVVLVEFGRHPAPFEVALLTCPLAEELRAEGVNIKPIEFPGLKVLARGMSLEKLHVVLKHLPNARGFFPKVVVVDPANEQHVHAAVRALPYRLRPRVKRRLVIAGTNASAIIDNENSSHPTNTELPAAFVGSVTSDVWANCTSDIWANCTSDIWASEVDFNEC